MAVIAVYYLVKAMPEYYISGIGIFGTGLVSWSASEPVLAGREKYVFADLPKLAPALLPAGVRRRAGSYIRLAAEVAAEAVDSSGLDPSGLASVFTTTESDGTITDAICRAICEAEPVVSPTLFHNSVTNAPAGYWCMAVQSLKPSTSIAGHEGTFSIGLVEACLQIETESNDTLYVCHDVTMPHPINKVANIESDYGTAMVITGEQKKNSLAAISWKVIPATEVVTEVGIKAIDEIRLGNPAARCLPLLAQIARYESGSVVLPYNGYQHLQVTISPCN